MLVNFLADVGLAIRRVIILERLQQPEAGDVGALVISSGAANSSSALVSGSTQEAPLGVTSSS